MVEGLMNVKIDGKDGYLKDLAEEYYYECWYGHECDLCFNVDEDYGSWIDGEIDGQNFYYEIDLDEDEVNGSYEVRLVAEVTDNITEKLLNDIKAENIEDVKNADEKCRYGGKEWRLTNKEVWDKWTDILIENFRKETVLRWLSVVDEDSYYNLEEEDAIDYMQAFEYEMLKYR